MMIDGCLETLAFRGIKIISFNGHVIRLDNWNTTVCDARILSANNYNRDIMVNCGCNNDFHDSIKPSCLLG